MPRPTRAASPQLRRPVLVAAAATAFALIAAVALLLGGCGKQDAQAGKMRVVASFYPMADFAEKIGGDHVEVKTLVPAGTEPHDWEPSARDRAELEDAKVFVYNGAGMEHWAEDVIKGFGDKGPILCEASKGVQLLGEPAGHDHDHDHDGKDGKSKDGHDHDSKDAKSDKHEGEGDGHKHADDKKDSKDSDHGKDAEDGKEAHGHDHDHKGTDPHVWLDPANAKIELKNICDAFVKADPAHKADYEKNYERWAAECDKLTAEYKQVLSACPGKEIVVSHAAFGYLCNAFGLTQLPLEGVNAEGDPSPADMAKLVDYVRAHHIRYVFSEELLSPKAAETLARETGAEVLELNPIEGISDKDKRKGADYFSVMRKNLEALKKALS